MQALTLERTEEGTRKIRYHADYPIPTPAPGEVLIKVLLAGICGTDLQLLQGYKSVDTLIPGHEFVGRIMGFGPACPGPRDRTLILHDRVVCEINCIPRHIGAIPARDRAHHPDRSALGIFGRHGAFATFVTAPYVNLHRVPDNVPTRIAVFAEPIAAACQILEQECLPPSGSLAVLGAGRLGWVVAKVLSAAGKRVEMITRRHITAVPGYIRKWGPSEEQTIPLVSLLDAGGVSAMQAVYNGVIDCTGSPDGLATSLQIVVPRGVVILKSTISEADVKEHGVDLSPVVVKEIRIVGSRCGPLDVALSFLKNGLLDVDSLISCVYDLEQSEIAFAKAKERGVLKVLFQFP